MRLRHAKTYKWLQSIEESHNQSLRRQKQANRPIARNRFIDEHMGERNLAPTGWERGSQPAFTPIVCSNSSIFLLLILRHSIILRSFCAVNRSMGAAPHFRALHWVLKDPDRRKSYEFYRQVLGMEVLRHEEFEGECKAACNGPYDNRWSKTMYGYGPENTYFACELTYNYPIKHYQLGNDLRFLQIDSSTVQARARNSGWPLEEEDDGATLILRAPGGYVFKVCADEKTEVAARQPNKRSRTEIETDRVSGASAASAASAPSHPDPFRKISLHVSDLERSTSFYRDELGMELVEKGKDPEPYIRLQYPADYFLLELVALAPGTPLDHAEAFGRIAFTISESPARMEEKIKSNPQSLGRVQTPLVSLDTPGKATVEVVILQDPDGYEICFVGESAFYELCARDPKAEAALQQAMEEDRSDEVPAWLAAPAAPQKDAVPAEKAPDIDDGGENGDAEASNALASPGRDTEASESASNGEGSD
jgi:catechol 2,3-dioxygenase-like lactoylglutathione lyase family enzyme